jgi:hypothetical protein
MSDDVRLSDWKRVVRSPDIYINLRTGQTFSIANGRGFELGQLSKEALRQVRKLEEGKNE